MKENEKNLRDLQGIIEHTSIRMRESQEGRRERKGQKKTFEHLMANSFSNLLKEH